MFNKRIAVLYIIVLTAVLQTACGNKVKSSENNVEKTTVAFTEESSKNQTQTTLSYESVIEASKEEQKRAEEIKSSIAAVVEQASREAESREKAIREKQESLAEARRQEVESQEAAMREEAAQEANKEIGPDAEVITIVDDYGIESARLQYTANYSVYVELVRLTNELRTSLGVPPLEMDENICIAACKKSIDYYLADYYDGSNHTMIDGRRWQSLFEDFNIAATARAENLAKGNSFKTARDMFEGWKNSKIHYDNMVNPAYTRVGVGSCGYVWFMDLAN